MRDPAGLEQAVAELRRSFASSLPDRRRALAEAWRALEDSDWRPDAREAAYRVAHSLAGAGETFGFTDVGAAARALADALHEAGGDASVPAAIRGAVEALKDRLAAALLRETEAPDTPTGDRR